MPDPKNFPLSLMMECYTAVRGLGAGATDMADGAGRIVRFLYESLANEGGERSCALVRFYRGTVISLLDEKRRRFALEAGRGLELGPHTPCLDLLATAGDEPAWNDPLQSAGHLAIPITSQEHVTRMPMIAKLLADFGLDFDAMRSPAPEDPGRLGIFHVPVAPGSPSIPAQDFVASHDIRSVLAFGGTLPGGDLYFVILFSKVHIAEDKSELFKLLALGVKFAILPFARRRSESSENRGEAALEDQAMRVATLEELLAEQERVSLMQARRVERLLVQVEEKNRALAATLASVEERNASLEALQRSVDELSTPILEVWDGVLALPLIGVVDERRSASATHRLLGEVATSGAHTVVLDVTGVAVIDEATAERLIRLVRAVELLGARCVLSGIRPAVARTLVELGVDVGGVASLRNLKHALSRLIPR